MIPPFKTPGNASYFDSGFHSATNSSPSPFGKLRMCSPSGLAGPQPKQALLGAYCSWSDCVFTAASLFGVGTVTRAGILPQSRSGIERARSNQPIIIVLLDHVRAPAGHTRSGKDRRV